MGIISTTYKISRTIKNINRLREIATVFARHGFDEFIAQGVVSRIPGFVLPRSTKKRIKDELKASEESSWGEIIGLRLRLCFEELGPAFVKFGQLFSSREDIFDAGFINQMKLLRDQVRPLPFKDVKSQVENALGKKIESVFISIDEQPIGTASIGLVYKAKLITGEDVVLKVRRPGISEMIDTDLSILHFLVSSAERVENSIKYLGLSRIVEDFEVSLQNEFNFNIEALNCGKITKIISKYDKEEIFYLPKIYSDFTKEDLLVMELIEGIPFTNHVKINEKIEELSENLNKAVKLFIQTFLNEGIFHADLHGGNFFYTKDKKIALIDFGLVGSLSRSARQNFVSIIYSFLNNNYEILVNEFLDVASYEQIPDVDKLVQDMRSSLSPFVGLTVKQVDFTVVLQLMSKTLRKHQIYLPSEWFIVFRAMITLDGVGKSLGLDFDLFALLEEDISEIIKNNFQKDFFVEESFWLSKDLLNTSRVVPRHVRWFLKEWSSNGYAFEHKHTGLEKSFNKMSTSLTFLGFSLMSCFLFMAGLQIVDPDVLRAFEYQNIPTFSYLLWSASIVMFLYGLNRADT